MTMITASTALTIFIMNIHFCGAEAKPVPHWAKVLIIDYMSKIFFVYEVGENCTSPKTQTQEDHHPRRHHHQTQTGKKRLHPNTKNHQQYRPRNDPSCPQPNGVLRGPTGPAHHKGGGRYPKSCPQPLPKIPEEHKDLPIPIPGPQNPHIFEGLESKNCLKGAPPSCCLNEEKHATFSTYCSCLFCCHHDYGDGGLFSGDDSKLVRNVEYIANCFREQRATCVKVAEWKKVAKVMDRFFMWIFFAMVFLMSILIMGKAPQ